MFFVLQTVDLWILKYLIHFFILISDSNAGFT